jgi:hypothetical protein
VPSQRKQASRQQDLADDRQDVRPQVDLREQGGLSFARQRLRIDDVRLLEVEEGRGQAVEEQVAGHGQQVR